jgi:endonuclease YncB( thermonuclease family)
MKFFKYFLYLILYIFLGSGGWYLLNNYLSIETRTKPLEPKLSIVPAPEEWQIISVYDGDTIKAKKSGITENFRLCGIDAPEVSQPLGKQSRDYLRSLIPVGKTVQISIVDIDKYNRKIAEVFIDGSLERFINKEIALKGLAYNYDVFKNCPNQTMIATGEEVAKWEKIGVWKDDHQKPWEYRKAQRKKRD